MPTVTWVNPSVRVIARTAVYPDAALQWINHAASTKDHVMAGRLSDEDHTSAQLLIEAAGRRCYNSFAVSANSNLTKIREDHSGYIRNIIKSKHGSVLEHASVTFAIEGVSRVFTHELCRHRAGCAISQESLRYVALDKMKMAHTPYTASLDLRDKVRIYDLVVQTAAFIESKMEEFNRSCAGGSVTFADKKRFTSWLRRFAPQGMATGLVWTANLRALRHIIPLRTAPGAEEEIRQVFLTIGRQVRTLYPDVFGDMQYVEDGEGGASWVCEHEKV